MQIYGIEEKDLRANKPFTLFEVEGKPYKVRLLPIDKADDWLTQVELLAELDKLLMLAKSMGENTHEKSAQHRAALKQCVLDYDPVALPREELEGKLSAAQYMTALMILKAFNDPFDFSQLLNQAVISEQLAKLPTSLVERAIASMQKPSD